MTDRTELDYPGAQHDRRWRELVFPVDYINPEPHPRYHRVVIGAGPAGLVTSIAAAGLGARVALIERQAMGGDCLNVGCVPSKALLEFTRRGSASFADAFEWLRGVRETIAQHDSVARYTEQGVDVFLGSATFVDPLVVQVGEHRITSRRVVIATGARPGLPPIPGLAESDPLTNETIFDLVEPPDRLAILGAGPVGCELSQALTRLGIDVWLFEMAERVLPAEHTEASAAVGEALQRDGVRVRTSCRVSEVTQSDNGVTLHTEDTQTTVDRVLVAAGRRANVEDLDLHIAGVQVEDGLITVDEKLRTTNPNIYAAGDVCSALQFTHNADAHARIVVQNALFAPTATTEKLIVPHCTYTDPEVAQVGRSRTELEQSTIPFDAYRVNFGDLDRGKAEGDRQGFVEVLTGKGRDDILGASIVAHDAGEQIAVLCVAMANGLGLAALGKAVLPYPTRGEYLRRLADTYNRTRLTPLAKRLMNTWFRWRD